MQNPENRIPPMLVNTGQACYHCFKDWSRTPLQRCSGYFHVYYCGAGCQRANWPKHKAICKAFKSIESKDGADLYAPFMFLDEDEETYVSTNPNKLNQCLDKVAQVEMQSLERELGRPLGMDERNMIGWEPRCLACGRSDAIFRIEAALRKREPQSQGLKPCPDCHFSFYCSEEHWEAVKHQHQHEPCQDGRDRLSQCAMNKMYVEDIRFALLMSGANSGEFKWAPERTLESWRSLRGVDWNDFEPVVKETFGGVQRIQHLLGAVLRGTTEALSMPMTILWALENLKSDDSWTKKDTLDIHILGPAEKEVLNADIFEEILHRLPLIKNLKLTLCGPELLHAMGRSPRTVELDTCPQCKRKGRKRVCSYYPTTYHEYISGQGADFTIPDLAIAFNSGCSQEGTDSWKTTIAAMIQRNIPGLFTAYNQEEAEAEAKLLAGAGATLHPELGPRRNIWGSLLSKTEPNKVTGFYAVNGWLAGGFR